MIVLRERESHRQVGMCRRKEQKENDSFNLYVMIYLHMHIIKFLIENSLCLTQSVFFFSQFLLQDHYFDIR